MGAHPSACSMHSQSAVIKLATPCGDVSPRPHIIFLTASAPKAASSLPPAAFPSLSFSLLSPELQIPLTNLSLVLPLPATLLSRVSRDGRDAPGDTFFVYPRPLCIFYMLTTRNGNHKNKYPHILYNCCQCIFCSINILNKWESIRKIPLYISFDSYLIKFYLSGDL